MSKKDELTNDVIEQEVLITRVFNAPRELVFKAWTEPEHLVRWYAPAGCSIKFEKIDVRPGGKFHSCIKVPNFHDCWCIGVYHEIVEPERIVFSMQVADANGNSAKGIDMGMDPEWPDETIVTVTFDDYGAGKTKLTLHQTVSESLAKKTGAYPSWFSMFELLDEELSQSQEIQK